MTEPIRSPPTPAPIRVRSPPEPPIGFHVREKLVPKFRAVITERNATIHFTLADLASPDPLFSIRELLLPWLRAGNVPDQFTGVKDRNRKEVYTSDILKFKLNTKYGLIKKTGVVRCESLAEGCCVKFLPDELDGIPLDSNVIELEVIGNKHEGVKS